MQKNVPGQKWRVFAFDKTNQEPQEGEELNITAVLSKDYGPTVPLTDTNPTEQVPGQGYYLFDLTQEETNANWLEITPAHSNPSIEVVGDPPSQPTFSSGGGQPITGGVSAGGNIEVRQGMDYLAVDGRHIVFVGETADQWPDLTGANVQFIAIQGGKQIVNDCTIIAATGQQQFYMEFPREELTSDLAPTGNYRYYVRGTMATGNVIDMIENGTFRVKQPYSRDE